ncbi:hypothetical protein MLOOGBEN_03295 [Bacillus sp. EB106-08-02-XG196]|jgi:gentisate 1,2-dioxygenase|uniref:hypothetical protein n=1 Tax=Bacillus sp. EB106-08-02-XG196 TaxID=2737049 RepID=UPI0015C42B67|nr:hypothetical protein [Bacillus sp. EB106-08-02-XG196]NWQ39726.1 hypothetical protein [Bacillus sp. EB106-08-02-XG196]
MEQIIVENEEIIKAVNSGQSYFQIGDRLFMLFEVDLINEPNVYEVSDSEEERKLLESLENDNPILSEGEIKRMLRDYI